MKYKWFFDESGVLTECEPKLDNDIKLEFAPESGEMFYRAKLTNALTFQIEFDDILSKGYSHTHVVVLQRFDDSENDFVEVWRGKFTLTDCTINFDRRTIEVTPATIDRYTDVKAALETDYNIVKLAPKMQPVNFWIRPCLQVYCWGDSKITNYIGENSWEATCDSGATLEELSNKYKFNELLSTIWIQMHNTEAMPYVENGITYNLPANTKIILTGSAGVLENASHIENYLVWTGSCYDSNRGIDVQFECNVYHFESMDRYAVSAPGHNYFDEEFNAFYDGGNKLTFTYSGTYLLEPEVGIFNYVCVRTLLNTNENTLNIGAYTLNVYDIPTNDIAGENYNYGQILETTADLVNIIESDVVQDTPTIWGQNYEDKYFVKPEITGKHILTVGQSLWWFTSLWWYPNDIFSTNIDSFSIERKIKDCYDLRNTIAKLLQKAGWNGQYVISGVFGSQGYVGNNLLPIITPKSNVISSYYDTPAQNAPISLAKIFSMLKQAYKVYWHIDENNNLHLEHISYYQNGYSYTELPQTLVDLESDLHTRTKHSKAYGQNVVKFDKSGMPGVISFGWMDKQTVPFDGYDIKALDAYIEQGLKEENLVGDFSTDVDFVLSSPNDVSKDGFFLFALPKIGGTYSNTLKIEKINITDENGDNYDVTIQNADAAFCKIHKTFWRYNMPCENLQINNVADTALTTGRFKTQTLEFADLSMADVIGDVDNCIKLIKTQQGYGAISKLSINLNSLSTTADLVFTLMGRKYYLKGAALNGPLTITLNGEQITINVENNRFVYGYTEPINELKFAGTDVVSVDFADTDTLDNLTATDDMFKNCTELIAVNFANKTFGAVISANDMFKGCVNLVDLICPDSSTWKADLDFSDCPDLTSASLYDLIKFLYSYNAGVHAITPNAVMWNALDATVQNDLIAKATAKGWTINIPAAYSITGQSAASTVYATINGSPVEIPVTAGSWQYDYNGAVTSFSFANDADVTDIDFSLSDGLAGVTSLNDAFKNCAGLTTVDFTNCDLSNVASASDAFANCSALYELIIPADSWRPDIDLSASVMPKTEMLNVINGLYVYTSGTHTISFNSTIWDAMTIADQQAVFDAADAKGWTTNAVAVVYVIRGTSSNMNGTETFNIQFIDDGALSPSAAETITCAVDAQGNWEYAYSRKKIYSLYQFSYANTTIISISFDELLASCVSTEGAFQGCTNLTTAEFPNATFAELTSANSMFRGSNIRFVALNNATFAELIDAERMFNNCTALTSVDLSNATFAKTTTTQQMFYLDAALISVDLSNATFAELLNCQEMFNNCTALTSIDLSNATFAKTTTTQQMFYLDAALTSVDLSNATFAELITAYSMFHGCTMLASVDLSNATFAKTTTTYSMFRGCKGISAITMPIATFAELTTAERMFNNCTALTSVDLSNATFANATTIEAMFYLDAALISVDLSNATFAKVNRTIDWLNTCNVLTTLNVPQNSTAILNASTAANAPMNLQYSPLTYASMLKVANWLSDLTGYTAHTCTFKASAWNALSSAEQATIQGILSGKNWNLATA